MRGVLAVVAGILAGFAAVVVIALIGGWIFPSPDRIDGLNSEQDGESGPHSSLFAASIGRRRRAVQPCAAVQPLTMVPPFGCSTCPDM